MRLDKAQMRGVVRHRGNLFGLVGAVALVALAPSMSWAQHEPEGYHLSGEVVIRSGDTGWDYNSIDPKRGHLFIAHRKAGLHVFDTKSGKFLKTLPNSEGTNTSALAEEFDRGIAGTTEGDVVLFSLSTLKPLTRYKSTTDGFDGAAYDKVTKRFVMVGEAESETGRTPVLLFDGKSGAQLGSIEVDSIKVDAPRPDGKGNIFLPLRDKNALAQIDIAKREIVATYALENCDRPAALEVDTLNQRVFVGCRGAATGVPNMTVVDAKSGKQIVNLPIGRGVDEMMYDPIVQAIYSANGDDGTMTVIRHDGADHYSVSATIGTRPRARTGVLDESTGKIYLVTAQFVERYREGAEPDSHYLPNTFTVLTLSK
ncbi:MAG: hypothetical protein JO269_02115 [Burkholderiaceae bacterium]|nr:hypothetical protein [Burkholderiaceae bacterium]